MKAPRGLDDVVNICCDIVSLFAGIVGVFMVVVGETKAAWGCLAVGCGWQVARLLKEKVRI